MQESLEVLIAGGGVAALEAAVALRDLAGERVSTTLLAPEEEFVSAPPRARAPFARCPGDHYQLAAIAADLDAELIQDSLRWLDPARRIVHTGGGQEISYDTLLVAVGARRRPRFRHALTLDETRLDEQREGLFRDVEHGKTRRIAFLLPGRMPWPLPLYELALMTSRRAWEMNQSVSITLVTPEAGPLAIFGREVSQAVEQLLVEHGIVTIPSTRCETPSPGKVTLRPGGRSLFVDRVIALPELVGPSIPGVPRCGRDGFISVDLHSRVRGMRHVFAAGDATDFPVKQGGIAAHQADVAAEAIASLAGTPGKPSTFHPVLRAVLAGPDLPLYLSAHITGGHGSSSRISPEPLWSPPSRIAARYLSPYLEASAQAAVG